MWELPLKYATMEKILQDMSFYLPDGSAGLLQKNTFGATVDRELPMYNVDGVEDSRLISALFRDYTYLASSYLLEPCHQQYLKDGTYGLGRQTLPKNISLPLWKLAEKLNAKPFMEYALSYALYNWKRKDPQGPIEAENVEIIRKFEGGKSEEGFIVTHVTMDAFTGELVGCVDKVLKAVEVQDHGALAEAFGDLLIVSRKINNEMDTMWMRSKPEDYNHFRTFILGIKSQPMFPKGVIYEGISDEPLAYRGESGANDSIIPTIDNLLETTGLMPKNPLTEILRDFRTYRPYGHNQYVNWVEQKARLVGVKDFSLSHPETALLYLQMLDHVREFRNRHWMFTKTFIINYTNHPVATGGSPIVSWLPNQLGAILDRMVEACEAIDSLTQTQPLSKVNVALKNDLEKRTMAQKRVLEREVADLKKRFHD